MLEQSCGFNCCDDLFRLIVRGLDVGNNSTDVLLGCIAWALDIMAVMICLC